MKNLVLLLFVLVSVLAYPSERDDVLWRLNHLNAENYRSSLLYLENKYGEEFSPGRKWESALTNLQENKTLYVTGLQENDNEILSKVKGLFSILDKAMLCNPLIKDKHVLVLRRFMGERARLCMGAEAGLAPSNFQNNSEISNPKDGWKNDFAMLKNIGKSADIESVYRPEKNTILNDPELYFDGSKILYSSIGSNDRWHLFELCLKDKSVRQVTPEYYKDFDSFDGCYTADDKYIFCSTGTFLGLPCTNGGNKMCGLFLYDPKTDKTRQLTFDQDSNWDPVILPNGKIMYQRWEYADLPHSNSRIIFTMNPDGTEQRAYYGSNSYFPTSAWGIRPIPDSPSQFIATISGHHSTTRAGRLMIFDTNKGRKEADGVLGEIPYFEEKVYPIVRDRLPDGVYPYFLHPFPLDDKYHLVVMKPLWNSLWGLYLVDTFNNITLVYEEEGTSVFNPIVVQETKRPNVIPNKVDMSLDYSTVFIQDIYLGEGLKGIPRGTVKKLRVGSYSFSPHGQGGLLGTIGMDGPWDIKQIEGTVDVEKDGSAMFKIPANTPIFIQPLDEDGKAVQLMRSWLTGMPGEIVSCIGCHEDQRMIPQPKPCIASKKKPQTIAEWKGQARGFSFEDEVQPILNKYCVQCHNGSDKDIPSFKGGKMISDWSSQISGASWGGFGGRFSESYANLHRYVRRPGIESDMNILVPMDVHADQTELIQILKKGHHGIEVNKDDMDNIVCWIDFNAPYYGRREDIPESDNSTVKRSVEMRKLYAEMFQTKERKMGTALKDDTCVVKPMPQIIEEGCDSVKNWPMKNAADVQTWLGCYRKTIEIDDGIYINMIKVPAGKFIMGSTRNKDEMPKCEVNIDRSFWIAEFEVSNQLYRLYDPKHDSRTEHRHGYQFGRKGYSLNEENQPVVRVSWKEAMDFCKWLSKKTGLNFNLPTEAQWEWACRAGSDKEYSFGDMGADFSNYSNLGDIKLKEYAACTAYKNYESVRIIDNPNKYDDWVPRDNQFNDGYFVSAPVGFYRANAWDIYDMHGNVWEWTRSAYMPYPYDENDGRNDIDNENCERVVRGGSWYDRPHRATSSYRVSYRNYQKVFNVGFRIVLED